MFAMLKPKLISGGDFAEDANTRFGEANSQYKQLILL